MPLRGLSRFTELPIDVHIPSCRYFKSRILSTGQLQALHIDRSRVVKHFGCLPRGGGRLWSLCPRAEGVAAAPKTRAPKVSLSEDLKQPGERLNKVGCPMSLRTPLAGADTRPMGMGSWWK
jgi:hypothetical protein